MDPLTRVAAWQCRPGPLDVSRNLRRLDAACASAAAAGAPVLVTPEMFTSGYAISAADAARFAADHDGSTAPAVAEIARRHGIAIAYGHPSPAPGGGVYNTATLVDADGVRRGQHRKVHLFGDMDRVLFVPGDSRPSAFDFGPGSGSGSGSGGILGGRVGMLICYDVEFPEAVRQLAVDGARIVLVPTANMTGYEAVQEILVRARACENGCGVVYANYCGADDAFTYNGRSVICGPDGSVLAQASDDGEELIVADLPASSAGTYLADRRADLYKG